MKTILVVGIGAGNPEHITMQAINALNRADVLFITDKGEGKSELADLRRDICRRYVTNPQSRMVEFTPPVRDASMPGYKAGVDDWHAALARDYARMIEDEIGEGGVGAFLVWGDPSLYDSTIRILDRIRTEALGVEIIPGITSVQALTAAHGIALNRIGESVHITTGRRLAEGDRVGDTVVMLDGHVAFAGMDPDLTIFWGAYLGTPDEITISGRLGDVAETIIATRKAARARHGWIMDTYLLREQAD